MALDLAYFRTALRDVLSDAGGGLWSDAALNDCVLAAVASYGYLFPFITRETYDVTLAANDVTGIESGSFVILGVECPPGTPLERDMLSPSRAGNSNLGPQGWTFRPNVIRLRNAASAGEAGVGKLVVWSAEWYEIPDALGHVFDGPVNDIPFILLLAHRSALQMLATWQVGGQGINGVVSGLASVTEHFDPGPVLDRLDTEIAREITIRQARFAGWWPLPPPIP